MSVAKKDGGMELETHGIMVVFLESFNNLQFDRSNTAKIGIREDGGRCTESRPGAFINSRNNIAMPHYSFY